MELSTTPTGTYDLVTLLRNKRAQRVTDVINRGWLHFHALVPNSIQQFLLALQQFSLPKMIALLAEQ